MGLKEEFERQGNLFFRYRSYLPLIVPVLFFIGLSQSHFHYPFGNHLIDLYWEFFCLAVSFFGLGIRIYTVGHAPARTSGRNTKEQVADSLNSSALYSVVRHPLYLGNFFIWLGISLFIRIWWISLLTILLFLIFYERIMFAEEEFLRKKFSEKYTEWAKRTPLFFPNFKNWQRPELPFSLKKAIRGEYHSFFAIIFLTSMLEVVGDFLVTKKFIIDPFWEVIFLISLIFYLIVRYIALKTNLLKTPDR